MTLVFSGNEYKYEIEGIMKLFIPATRFKTVFSDTVEEDKDFVFISVKEHDEQLLLSITADHLGKREVREQLVLKADDFDAELLLSKLLYRAMSEITGIKPKWGVMTGVRPVKRVNRYIDAGLEYQQIKELFKREYYCSEEKLDIAYRTAQVQRKIMGTVKEDSFSLYVNIPFCPTRCSYCSFISQTIDSGKKLIPDYIKLLCRELEYTAEISQRLGLKLDTIYFGGGTPTSLEPSQLESIMQTIEKSFDLSTLREYTIEAGRADTITREKLETIKRNGCTRISVNPQTLNDKVLEAIGRRHTSEQFYKAFSLARELGFDCINTDIIAGLPTDTLDSFERTIEGLIALEPENITVHTLSIKRAADLNYAENKGEVLKNSSADMVDYASLRLTESGYQPYYLYRQKNMLDNLENIGWSKSGMESLYNIFIMEEIQTILAVGAGASSKLVDLKGKRLDRIFNYKHPLEYIKHFDIMLEKKKEIADFYAKEK